MSFLHKKAHSEGHKTPHCGLKYTHFMPTHFLIYQAEVQRNTGAVSDSEQNQRLLLIVLPGFTGFLQLALKTPYQTDSPSNRHQALAAMCSAAALPLNTAKPWQEPSQMLTS